MARPCVAHPRRSFQVGPRLSRLFKLQTRLTNQSLRVISSYATRRCPTAVEDKFALGVLQIAASRPNGLATLKRCKAEISNYVNLNANDLAASVTRPGEPMWHQIVRNIKSHSKDEGNYIHEGYLDHVPRVGYRITDAGMAYLKSKGLN